jgi:nitrogenase molybdenum-iron protein beta chain
MGLFPLKQYAMEDVGPKFKPAIENAFKDLNYGISAEVVFETDGYKVHEQLRESDFIGYPLIIGSSWDKKVAQELSAHFLPISWPLNERLIVNSSYVGYDGALHLLEDIYSVVLQRYT